MSVGDRVGPDLFGLTERRDRDWLLRYISDPVKMRREGDPTALALREAYPAIPMPRLTQLGAGDIKAAIDYVAWETERIVKMRQQHPIQDDGHSAHAEGEAGHGHDAAGDSHGAAGHEHGHAAGDFGDQQEM